MHTGVTYVQVVTFDYGKREKNPVNSMKFYNKETPHKAVKFYREQVSRLVYYLSVSYVSSK